MEQLGWQSPDPGNGTRPLPIPEIEPDTPERVTAADRPMEEPGEASPGEVSPSEASPGETPDVTALLRRWRRGDSEALGRLLPGVYQELRRLARGAMRGERRDHTLQATALVHEAFLRLSRGQAPAWRNRGHFFAVMARTMRHILVDHARASAAARRGGGASTVRLSALVDEGENVVAPGAGHPLDLLVFDEALHELATLRPRQAQVLELRAFGGLSVVEVAEALDVSRQTVVLDTRLGRAWLVARLRRRHD